MRDVAYRVVDNCDSLWLTGNSAEVKDHTTRTKLERSEMNGRCAVSWTEGGRVQTSDGEMVGG